jgi:hypothetical protein
MGFFHDSSPKNPSWDRFLNILTQRFLGDKKSRPSDNISVPAKAKNGQVSPAPRHSKPSMILKTMVADFVSGTKRNCCDETKKRRYCRQLSDVVALGDVRPLFFRWFALGQPPQPFFFLLLLAQKLLLSFCALKSPVVLAQRFSFLFFVAIITQTRSRPKA